jgi:hypothetical protein
MPINWKLTAITISILATLSGVVGVSHAKQPKPGYVMIPSGSASYALLDPKNPQGLQQAILSGDPKVGPVAFIMKFPKGRLPLHFHSSDYYGWVVEGKMKHWLPGKEAEAQENPPGSFWFQPGGANGVHDDECMSDTCKLYVIMTGKFDAIPVASAQANEKK